MTGALADLFSLCEQLDASDIHLLAGRPPRFRIRGELEEIGSCAAEMDVKKVDALAMELGLSTLPPGTPAKAGSSPKGRRYRLYSYF